MDDEGDDWGDVLGGFDVGNLTVAQRQVLSDDLSEAGILHTFVGPELQGPAAESEVIEHLIQQVQRRGRSRREPSPPSRPSPNRPLPRALRFPWGAVPPEAATVAISAPWRRFVGYLVEALGFGVLSALVYAYSAVGAQLVAVGAGLISSIVLVALLGASIGMMVFRMRVVVLGRPGAVPGWRVAGIRYAVAWWPVILMIVLDPFVPIEKLAWLNALSEVWLVVCFFPILLDPARRGLHDRIAGTLVVDAPPIRRVRRVRHL